jgi:hypothetical protein
MSDISYELYKANQQLLARRAALQAGRERPNPHPSIAPKNASFRQTSPKEEPTPTCQPFDPSQYEFKRSEESYQQTPVTFTLPQSLCTAVLQRKVTAPARVWLLLRMLDQDGRGWLPLDDVRERLTGDPSPMRLCGQRHLRTLLNNGDGRFWTRQDGRLWLRSTAKVAASLGVEKFRGPLIELPLATLTGPIGHFRSQLYAAFHSGRSAGNHHSPLTQLQADSSIVGHQQADSSIVGHQPITNHHSPITQSPPISRAALTTITGLSRRSQHAYERRANIKVRPNYALGPQCRCIARDSHTSECFSCTTYQEYAWQKGTAVFPFHDHKGKHGRKGTTYIAWQLPNSYTAPNKVKRKTRNRRLNRKLADLRNQRDAGNDQPSGASPANACMKPPPPPPNPLYHQNPATLAKVINRRDTTEGYWPGRPLHTGAKNGRFWYWVRVE